MDRSHASQTRFKDPPIRPGHFKSSDERRSLLSFYQRYSYRDGPREGNHNVNGNNSSPPGPATILQKVKSHLSADISTRWADLVLMVCFMVSGLVDSCAYNAYNCFVSMQTGNTIFLALGANDLPIATPSLAWTKSLTSILSFLLGAGLISAFHRTFGERKRWVLAASFSFQMAVTIVSAILVSSGSSSESPARPGEPSAPMGIPRDIGFPSMDLVPIGLLSFQAAGKVVASRVLGYNALPAVVLTTLYNDLASDPALLTAGLMGNVQRNRRLGGLLSYVGGALIGGTFARSSLGFAGALYFTAGIKLLVVLGWLAWRDDGKESDVEEG